MNETTETRPASAQKQVEVTLKKPHTHRGKEHAVGDKIKLTERQTEWLKKRGKV